MLTLRPHDHEIFLAHRLDDMSYPQIAEITGMSVRQAYVNARYSPHYEITPEELAWISERVALL